MKDLMTDIETAGNGKDAAIFSIGAVMFDRNAIGTCGDEFYRVVELQSCLDIGMNVDASTIYWWLQQSEEARAAICSPDRISIMQALLELDRFYTDHGAETIWCHGGNFDEPILATAYRMAKLPLPWSFRAMRDTRTVYDVLNAWPDHSKATGVYHNALDDAKNQVLDLQGALQVLRHSIVPGTLLDNAVDVVTGIDPRPSFGAPMTPFAKEDGLP